MSQHSLLSLAINSTLTSKPLRMSGTTKTIPCTAVKGSIPTHVGWRQLSCTALSHVTEAWRRPLIAEYCVRDGILLVVVAPLLAARSSVCRTAGQGGKAADCTAAKALEVSVATAASRPCQIKVQLLPAMLHAARSGRLDTQQWQVSVLAQHRASPNCRWCLSCYPKTGLAGPKCWHTAHLLALHCWQHLISWR